MEFTAIILAGGKSIRMGEDKGLMFLNGKPMIQHVIDVVQALTHRIIIISNNSDYKKFNYPIFNDSVKNKGPLGGLLTGLENSTTAKNLVLSCDAPYVNKALIELLLFNSKNYDVVIPIKDKQTHQLIGVYDKNCLPILKKKIANNNLKIKTAIQEMNYKIIDANHIDTHVFHNINTKEDVTT